MSWFEAAFTLVVGVEGGYVNDPADPGGETRYGISKRRYPDEDIKNLTLSRAQLLYKRDYWDANKLDQLDWGKALLLFDCAVNGGPYKRWYDTFGGQPTPDFAINFQAERAQYLASLSTWSRFGRGWMRRLFKMFDAAGKPPGG